MWPFATVGITFGLACSCHLYVVKYSFVQKSCLRTEPHAVKYHATWRPHICAWVDNSVELLSTPSTSYQRYGSIILDIQPRRIFRWHNPRQQPHKISQVRIVQPVLDNTENHDSYLSLNFRVTYSVAVDNKSNLVVTPLLTVDNVFYG